MATARYYNEDKADGQHIWGVPARDLTDDEYEALPRWLQQQVDDSPLYRKTAPPKKTTTAPKATGAAEKPSEARTDTDAVDGTRNITKGDKEA